jgi:hypothetical protein
MDEYQRIHVHGCQGGILESDFISAVDWLITLNTARTAITCQQRPYEQRPLHSN